MQLTIQKYKDTARRGAEPQTGAAPQDTQDLENTVSSVWEWWSSRLSQRVVRGTLTEGQKVDPTQELQQNLCGLENKQSYKQLRRIKPNELMSNYVYVVWGEVFI